MTFDSLIYVLQSLPVIGVQAISLCIYFSIILLLYFYLGKDGLYIFISIAIIGANLQVMKVVEFPFFDNPVALGTGLFSCIYLCTDILAEYEGHKAAKKGIWIGFVAMLLWSIITTLTIGFRPPNLETDSSLLGAHDQINGLFRQVPALFVAGMSGYLISQFHDIFLYRLLRKRHGKKWLWLRNNLSTMLSALIDNTVFSLLAWIVLAEEPLDIQIVIQTYILGTYLLRIVIALLDTPFLYMVRYVRRIAPRFFK